MSRSGGLRSNLYRLKIHMPEEEAGDLMGVSQPESSEPDGGLSPHDGGLSHHPTRAERPPGSSGNRQIESLRTTRRSKRISMRSGASTPIGSIVAKD